jgi:hypothetical protein
MSIQLPAHLDAQISLDVPEKLLVLQNHQDQLRAAAVTSTSTPVTKALAAKGELRSISPRREKSRRRRLTGPVTSVVVNATRSETVSSDEA